jgi:hypothetical protein
VFGSVGVGAPEEAHEVPPAASRVLHHAQAHADEGADQRLGREQPAGGLALEAVEIGDARRVHRVK